MMLMRICKCGRRVKQGESCPCQKYRHKIYDKEIRDKAKRDFYHTAQWRKIAEVVKTRANGLDEYLLATKGLLEVGSTVHHIYTLEERPDLKTSLSNLIFVSSRTHNRIHAEYSKGENERKELQRRLKEIVCGRGCCESSEPPSPRPRPPFIYAKMPEMPKLESFTER